MKVSRVTVAVHRQALLEQGGRLLRRHGIGGVSVAELARAAGLTHGAFYGHFPSKAALVAESIATSLSEAAARWRRRADRARAADEDPLGAVIAAYLSQRHRDTPEAGCALAALGPEVSRAEPILAEALRQGTAALADVLAEEVARLCPTLAPAEHHARALAILAAMTGGLVLARALAADADASRAALARAARLARIAAFLPA